MLVSAALVAVAAPAPAHAAKQAKKAVHGAIAYEPTRRALGYSYDLKSAREAKIAALRQCGDPACVVLVSFSNACGAIARGPGKPFAATGATRAEAQAKALRRCGNEACQVLAWTCTK